MSECEPQVDLTVSSQTLRFAIPCSAANARRYRRRAAARAVTRAVQESGDMELVVAHARSVPRVARRQERAMASGLENARDAFFNLLAANPHLLALAVTDLELNIDEAMIQIECESEKTRFMMKLMVDYKKLNMGLLGKSAYGGYDTTKPAHCNVLLYFKNRSWNRMKTITHEKEVLGDDMTRIQLVQQSAVELKELREKILDWYKNNQGTDCTLYSRMHGGNYTNASIAPLDLVVGMVNDTLLCDEKLRELFTDLLLGTAEGSPKRNDFCRDSILNGSFYMTTKSTMAFGFNADLLELGFPLDMANSCGLNLDLWNDLLSRTVAQGNTRQGFFSGFLLIWCVLRGRIDEECFEITVPGDGKTKRFFKRIIKELHEGNSYEIVACEKDPYTRYAKKNVGLRIYDPCKLCSVLAEVLDDDPTYIPSDMASWCRHHANKYNNKKKRKRAPAAAVAAAAGTAKQPIFVDDDEH